MNTYSRPLTITYIRSLLVVFLPGLPSGRSPVLGCDALLPQIARQLLAISAYLSAFLTSEKAHARIFLWLNATSRKVLSFVAKRRTPGSGSRAAVRLNRALGAQQTSLLSLIKFNTSLQRVFIMVASEKRLVWHPRGQNKFVVGGSSQITLYEWLPDSSEIKQVASQLELNQMKVSRLSSRDLCRTQSSVYSVSRGHQTPSWTTSSLLDSAMVASTSSVSSVPSMRAPAPPSPFRPATRVHATPSRSPPPTPTTSPWVWTRCAATPAS